MESRHLGIIVTAKFIQIVDATIVDREKEQIFIERQFIWLVTEPDRPRLYADIYREIQKYIKENSIDVVVMKASALSMKNQTLSTLTTAELRGAILAATATECKTILLSKPIISKTYGSMKIDDYVRDDDFWSERIKYGTLDKENREVAMLIIASLSNINK